MARKSRKSINIGAENETQKQEVIYNTAVYARLSIEDMRGSGECSIETQIELVKQYIGQRPYLSICGVFADNGATGTNFNRPSFINMIEEVKNGNINCIVVKDLSRFGRDYLEVGNYLEKIFPFMNVRFISINDHYDSFDVNAEKEALSISLKSLVHDMYAKDISAKVQAALYTKRKNGTFIGSFPPFGYKKNKENKSLFLIDEETAPIVRDIFQMKLEGLSYRAISKKLNERDLPSPYNFAYMRGYVKSQKYAKKIHWAGSVVKNIIENETYIGNMVQGRARVNTQTTKVNVAYEKGKRIIVENTHEPLIEKELFYQVQVIVRDSYNKSLDHCKRNENFDTKENIFRGKLICAHCSRTIKRGYNYSYDRKRKYYNYQCNYCRDNRTGEKSFFMTETALISALQGVISTQIQIFVDFQALLQRTTQSSETNANLERIQKSITVLKQRATKIETLLKTIYEDFSDGLLSKEEYLFAKQRYLLEHEGLIKRQDELIIERSRFDGSYFNDNKFVQTIETYRDGLSIDKELLNKLIDRIVVNSDRSLEIQFKFKEEYNAILNFIREKGVNHHE